MKTRPDPVPSEPRRCSRVVRVPLADEVCWFNGSWADHHYLSVGRSVGDYLRQVVKREGRAVVLLVVGPVCYALKDRDFGASWSAAQRLERLKLIVQNRRFLILTAKGESSSQAKGVELRTQSEQCPQYFGDRLLLVDHFPHHPRPETLEHLHPVPASTSLSST